MKDSIDIKEEHIRSPHASIDLEEVDSELERRPGLEGMVPVQKFEVKKEAAQDGEDDEYYDEEEEIEDEQD